MSVEPQAIGRSLLEGKDRDELSEIAERLGLKPSPRAGKATLIDQILVATGVEEPKPKRARARKKTDGDLVDEGAPGAPADEAVAAEAEAGGHDAPTSVAGVAASGLPAVSQAAPPTEVGEAAAEAARAGSEAASAVSPGVPAGATVAGPGGEAGGGRTEAGRDETGRDETGHTDRGRDETRPDEAGPAQGGQGRANQQPNQQPGQARPGGQGPGGQPRQGQGGQAHGGQGAGQLDVGEADVGNRRSRRRRGRDRRDRDFANLENAANQPYDGEPVDVEGLLDLRDEGFGFLRTKGYLPSSNDVYVSVSQVRRFALRKGDYVKGASRPAGPQEKYPAMLRIDTVNGMTPDEARERRRFEDLTPLFPDERLRMEIPNEPHNVQARIIDLISPIGKGQRGLIVSPPKAGKTTVMKQIARSIETNNPEVHLMVLLVDERPEEVTDMRRWLHRGEVIASTFDRPADEHTHVAELTIERAKRLVELGQDVVIILDGITRLARAYNLAAPATGRIMSGGVDSGALYPPKKFFGAARNIEEGGSLTILATALVETGSRMDEVIFEEFKGTGNMELRLDRRLAERRIYPAIDVNASSTRHEELLFERKQLEMVWRLRRVLNGLAEGGSAHAGLELLIDKIKSTRTNDEFLAEIAKAPSSGV